MLVFLARIIFYINQRLNIMATRHNPIIVMPQNIKMNASACASGEWGEHKVLNEPNPIVYDGNLQVNSPMGNPVRDGFQFDGQKDLGFLGIAEGRQAAKNKIKRDLIAKGIPPSDARKMVRKDPATVALVKDKQAAYKDKAKANGLKIWQGVKTIAMSAPRGAAESLIRINYRGKAKQLNTIRVAAEKGDAAAKAKWDKTTTFWLKIGGNRTNFKEAVIAGSDKKAFLGTPKKGFDGQEQLNFAGVDDATIALWVGTGSSIIATLTSLVGKAPEETGVPDDASNMSAGDMAAMQEALAAANEEPIDSDSFIMPTWAKIGIGVLTVGVTITTIALIVKHYKNKKG